MTFVETKSAPRRSEHNAFLLMQENARTPRVLAFWVSFGTYRAAENGIITHPRQDERLMDAPSFARPPRIEGGVALGRRVRHVLGHVVREPLVHFFLLGVLIFAGSAVVTASHDDAARRIVVDAPLVRHLAGRYESQMGMPPTKSQLDALIEDYIQEELRFREAKRLELDKDDEIIRRRLASKFDFLQGDPGAVREPTAPEIQAYYDAHQQEFAQPATATFTHVYFSPDRDGEPGARARAEEALAALASTTVTRAPERGDPFSLQIDFVDVRRLDVVQAFGENSLADAVFGGAVARWLGPVRSGYGWHLVYVSRREEPHVLPLAEIREKVQAAYLDAVRAHAARERDAALERRYIVERAYGP